MDVFAFLVAKGLLSATADMAVSRLKGGYWNDVFRVQGEGVDWVAKVFRVGWAETLYPIMPDAEAKALEVLGGETAVSPVWSPTYIARLISIITHGCCLPPWAYKFQPPQNGSLMAEAGPAGARAGRLANGRSSRAANSCINSVGAVSG